MAPLWTLENKFVSYLKLLINNTPFIRLSTPQEQYYKKLNPNNKNTWSLSSLYILLKLIIGGSLFLGLDLRQPPFPNFPILVIWIIVSPEIKILHPSLYFFFSCLSKYSGRLLFLSLKLIIKLFYFYFRQLWGYPSGAET